MVVLTQQQRKKLRMKRKKLSRKLANPQLRKKSA
jgi:hypothetical protein